jgi:acetyl-CoA carboxylase carboxyl transferase subunit alpha
MNPNFLDFEQPIAELDAKIEELRHASDGQAFNIEDEVGRLREKLKIKTAEIFRNLNSWQTTQLSRHPARPYTLDYIGVICEEFHELAGDRMYAEDAAIVGGLGRVNGRPMVIIGHQKGRNTKDKVRRNFGMPRPEGYRKALRLMKMAERFGLPLLTLIDTPGAYPGVGAEERGQSEAIARNLLEMAELKVPIICTVIGEGGSGGALAVGVGDRMYAEDAAIVGGLGRINGRSVVIIGHQKGRDTKTKVRRNFGMPRPEGYRKALRLMQMAERFGLPLLTLIDTPGAYPGVGAEERGQSEAIARNLLEMAELKVPIICTVIGEGGSGGALAIGVGDRTNMLQYSTYSVISPEGCASILWKSADKVKDAAEALGMTAPRLLELGLIDKLIREPLGGAHRNPRSMAIRLKAVLLNQLDELQAMPVPDLLEQRYKRLRSYGAYQE